MSEVKAAIGKAAFDSYLSHKTLSGLQTRKMSPLHLTHSCICETLVIWLNEKFPIITAGFEVRPGILHFSQAPMLPVWGPHLD